MDRTPVRSSNIASIGYDPVEGILEVEFHDSGLYEYYRVPDSVHRGFVSAASPGTYFADHIKDRYRFRRLR